MFDGDFRKRKTVNHNPKTTSLENRTSTTSRFEKISKSRAFLQDSTKKRQNREFEKSAESSAIKIQATWRMYKIRKLVTNQEKLESLINVEKISFTTRALLQHNNLIYSSSKIPTDNSVDFFAYLIFLNNNVQELIKCSVRIRRLLQFSGDSEKKMFAESAVRVSNSWFWNEKIPDNLKTIPWELVRKNSDSGVKRQVLRKLVRAVGDGLHNYKSYLDGYIDLADTIWVLENLNNIEGGIGDFLKFSLYQENKHTHQDKIVDLAPETVLRLFTFSKLHDDIGYSEINKSTNIISDVLRKMQPQVSMDEDDEDDEDDEEMEVQQVDSSQNIVQNSQNMHKLPQIIKLFNELDPNVFLRSNFNLDTLGHLVSTLLLHHSKIEHILVLQKVSESDLILKKFINFLCENLACKNKLQIRKYIRTSNDFNTWFKILSFRLSQARDELWLSQDPSTTQTIKLFMNLTEHLRELICLCCAPSSGHKVSSSLLLIVNRLAMLNTVRKIDNFDAKLEICDGQHPLGKSHNSSWLRYLCQTRPPSPLKFF